ncbi:hypothetical protein ACIP5T_03060 [Microbacterium sp. NPDC088619]|uniref:hypothetical protein n=1 Tax=Microbacterium sp. NPDC088619 TaxID=3364196 RepID=UPI0038030C48
MFDIRLREYTPAGVRGRVIPTLEIDSTDAESATSTLTFSMSAHIAERMEAPFVVGLEYTTGSSWSTPRNNLYVVLADAEDAADQTDVMKFTAQSYVGWLLSNALHWWNTDSDGNNRTYDMTPGRLVRQLVAEAKGTTAGVVRGWAPMLTTAFTDTADSLGQAWTADDQIKMEVDLWRPYSALFQTWIEQGHFEWWAEGTTLMLARLGTGADLTSKVALGGPGFDSAPAKTDFKGTFSTIVLIPDKANATHAYNAGADTRFGSLETSISMSGVSDSATAVRMAQPVMKENRAKKLELSFDWTPAVGGPAPWADFTVGDLVIARRKVGKLSQRVVGIQVSKRDGVVSARAIVGSKLVGLQAKLAKRVGSTTTGGIIGGSGAGVPFKPGVKRPDPIAPSGLMVTSAAYFDAVGTSYASVTATCSTVTTDVMGGTVKIKWYELWAKKNSSGESWTRLARTEVEPPSMTYTGLLGGESWSFKVRAYADENVISAFSPVFSLVLANDTTAPPVPAPPVGTSRLGQVLITHNGLTATGAAQPIDFAHFNVWMSTTALGTGSKVGEVRGNDTFVAPQQPYDQARWFFVTAVDKSGNESAASTRISVTTQSVVSTDITDEAMDAITEIVSQDVVSSIGGTVTWSVNAPVVGDGSGKPVGAMWYQRDGSNNVIGMWEWSGSAWLPRVLADATLGNISAAKITLGFLDAARIQSNTITASKIAIGDFTNLVNGSDFEDDAKIPFVLTTGFTTAGDTFHTGLRSLRIAAGATTRIAATGYYDVQGGEQYYATLWARRSGTYNGTSADSKLSVRIPGLGLIGAIPYGVADIPTTNTWTELKTIFTVPAGASTRMFFDVRGDHTAGDVRLDDIIIRRMNAGELIVDGAIIAPKLATNSVETDKLAANAVKADKIDAGAITTVKLDALAVTTAKLAVDAVDANKLTANAITSKHTITGAKFQTTATPSRGIEITSAGLNAYNSSGQKTVEMVSSTGDVTITGTIRNRISGPRVEINSNDTRGLIWFYGAAEGGTIRPASIQSDPNGQSLLLYGGNNNTASPIYTTLQLNERSATVSWMLGRSGFEGAAAYPRIRGDENTTTFWERSTGHRLTLATDGYTEFVGNGVRIYGSQTVTGSKSFAMDHPTKPGMTLTHASTESPYNGVEYWSDGLVEMPAQGFKTVTLPSYFEALTAEDHRVAILTAGSPDAGLWYEPITDGKFIVHGTAGALFSWGVKARRVQIVDGRDVLAFPIESTSVAPSVPTEPDKEMSIEA